MTLRYKKSHLRLLAGLGVGLVLVAAVMYWLGAGEFIAVFLAMGLYNIVLYVFRSNRHYLAVRNGVIIKSGILGGSVPLNDIRSVNHVGGDVFIHGSHAEIPVYTAFLDPESLRRFTKLLQQYEQSGETNVSRNQPITG